MGKFRRKRRTAKPLKGSIIGCLLETFVVKNCTINLTRTLSELWFHWRGPVTEDHGISHVRC